MGDTAKHGASVHVRAMTVDDIDGVLAIDKEFVGSQRLATYADPRDDYLGGELDVSCVAEADGIIVGFALGRLKDSPHGQSDTGWLEAIGVLPDYQRQGIGTWLVEAFADRCLSKGAKAARIRVSWNDESLLALLRSLGFSADNITEFQKML